MRFLNIILIFYIFYYISLIIRKNVEQNLGRKKQCLNCRLYIYKHIDEAGSDNWQQLYVGLVTQITQMILFVLANFCHL